MIIGVAVALSMSLAGTPPKIGQPGVQCSGVEPALCESYGNRFATLLGTGGAVQVITQRDIAAQLGVERQRQLLGCGEDGACTAELAGALGVDGLLTLSIAQSGELTLLTARVTRSPSAQVRAQSTQRAEGPEQVLDRLDAMARLLRQELSGVKVAEPTLVEKPPSLVMRIGPIVLGAVGLASFLSGLVAYGLGWEIYVRLNNSINTIDEARRQVEEGRLLQQAGIGAMIGGGALFAAALVWRFLPAQATVAPVAWRDGAGLSLVVRTW